MVEVIESATFRRWIRSLRDRRAVARINIRIRQASEGHFGDIRAVGSGVCEVRTHYGPGYRLYFARKGQQLIHPAVRWRQGQSATRHSSSQAVGPRVEMTDG